MGKKKKINVITGLVEEMQFAPRGKTCRSDVNPQCLAEPCTVVTLCLKENEKLCCRPSSESFNERNY